MTDRQRLKTGSNGKQNTRGLNANNYSLPEINKRYDIKTLSLNFMSQFNASNAGPQSSTLGVVIRELSV